MSLGSLTKPNTIFTLILLIIAIFIPFIVTDPYIQHLLTMTLMWGIVVTNWNLTLGYGGMFHIAQLTFFAIGGYGSAIMVNQTGISPWLGLLMGGIFACVSALIIGLPSLRVRGVYLILLTFAFHFGVLELTNIFRDVTGGTMGIMVKSLSYNDQFYYFASLILLVISIAITQLIIRSNVGKALIAIRDSEVLAISSGINPTKYKLITFILSAFITGIAGGIYGSYLMVIGPEIFSFTLIVNGLGMIVIGGMGTIFGPLVGSFIITFFTEIFSFLEDFRPIIIGVVIILMLYFAPDGLVREFQKLGRRLWNRLKKQ